MAWNEPGGNQNKQNPWGRGNKPSASDFQKLFGEFKKQLQQMSRKPGSKNLGGGSKMRQFFSRYAHYAIPALVIFMWLLASITVIDSGEQAVVLNLGKFDRVLNAGVHWVPAFIEKAYVIPQQQINAVTFTGSTVTKDDQVLTFTLNVQYRIANPKAYLFAVADPEQSLENAVSSSVDQVVSAQDASMLLAEKHQTLNQQLLTTLNAALNTLNPGFVVTDVSVQSLEVPSAVADARADVLKAQQDNQQVINQARDNASQMISQAQAKAEQLLADAQAYQQKVVLKAQGDTARYLALLPEYQQNPQVTRERLYVTMLQPVLQKVTKIFVDVPNSQNLQVNIPLQPSSSNAIEGGKQDAGTESNLMDAAADKNDADQLNTIPGYGSDTDTY